MLASPPGLVSRMLPMCYHFGARNENPRYWRGDSLVEAAGIEFSARCSLACPGVTGCADFLGS